MEEETNAIKDLARIKELSRIRQKKFYDINKERITTQRREKYKQGQGEVKEEPKVEPVIPKHYKTLDDIVSKLSETNQSNYAKHLDVLFKILKTNNFIKSIQNAKKVINAINTATYTTGTAKEIFNYSTNSRKAFIQSLLVAITILNLEVPEKQVNMYKNYFDELKLESVQANEEKKENEQVMDFKDYLYLVEKTFGLLSKESIMSLLYHELTIRDDFQLLIVADEAECEDKTKQYIIVPELKTRQITVIINEYKTDKLYGQIKEKLSKKLSELIRKYIAKNDIQYGNYLFGKAKSNSDFVSKMNKKIGLSGGINLYRHMKASELGLTNADRVKLADRMKNSPLVNIKYIRKLLK